MSVACDTEPNAASQCAAKRDVGCGVIKRPKPTPKKGSPQVSYYLETCRGPRSLRVLALKAVRSPASGHSLSSDDGSCSSRHCGRSAGRTDRRGACSVGGW